MPVNASDKHLLRELANKVAEIGNAPVQKERAELWRRHNDLQPGRPLVLIFPEGAWREMLTDKELTCQDPDARGLEWDLRHRLYYAAHLQDDNVIEPVIACWATVRDSGWGISQQRVNPEDATGAAHYEPVIKTEADIEKIKIPEVTVDFAATEKRYQELTDIFGGILTVEKRCHAYTGFAIMDEFATWRGLGQVLIDLTDRPEWVHACMERMYQGMVARHEAVMKSGAVTLNNRNHYTGSGGTGYTSQLPQADFDGTHVRSKDLWSHATTQIFSDVSPGMHEEFALQYERRYQARFGLNCYGCCEPLHNKFEIAKTIPNLRRISVSPWADVKKSAAQLGNKYIYSWKPNPAAVAGEAWDPAYIRKWTREFLETTRGCVVEMIMKDTHTCKHEPRRMWEWVKIAREEAERFG